jgi:hypothetical protein
VLLYGFLVVLFAGIAGSLAKGGTWDGGASPRLLPILIVLALALIPLTVTSALRSVDRRVRFEPIQELISQPAPPPARPGPAPARPSATGSDALELDLDRSWNKKG